ncbi:Hypothetical predicted protein [Paramuricea clavata]|uniref:Uncharacterized protein n=1 Tax=Paramuricea clavata TaxID=317549 RepID=A0A7D9HP50_PARCT|nr:Hypothetical predicted protein [Paramuricea clavata]
MRFQPRVMFNYGREFDGSTIDAPIICARGLCKKITAYVSLDASYNTPGDHTMILRYFHYGCEEILRGKYGVYMTVSLKQEKIHTNIVNKNSLHKKMCEDIEIIVSGMLAYDIVKNTDDIQLIWLEEYGLAVDEDLLYEFDAVVKQFYSF